MNELVTLLQSDANSANAFGAIASAAAALLALLVSVISLYVSFDALRAQRRHNALSVRPLAEITVADYENSLRIKLRNNGSGPMIVIAVTVGDGASTKPSIIDWMPKLPNGRPWTTFVHAVEMRSILPGAELVLIELTEYENEKNFAKCRDLVRASLCRLTVNVEYTNIYDTVLKPHRKTLAWFGRHCTVGA